MGPVYLLIQACVRLQVLMVDPTKGSEEVFETVEDGDEMDVDADDSDAEEGGHKHSHAAAEKGNASDSDESEKSEDDDADSADESVCVVTVDCRPVKGRCAIMAQPLP